MGHEHALIRMRVVVVLALTFLLQSSLSFLILYCYPSPQLQAVDEAAVEMKDQMPADPQEPLEETVDSCLLKVMRGGHSWYMLVYADMLSGDVKCVNPSDWDLHSLKYVAWI